MASQPRAVLSQIWGLEVAFGMKVPYIDLIIPCRIDVVCLEP